MERTLLGEAKGGQLLTVSPQARVLVFGSVGNLRVRDTVSGQVTSIAGRVEDFSRDERWMLFSRWEDASPGALLELEVATGRVREPVPGVEVRFDANSPTPAHMRRLITEEGERVWFYDLRTARAVPVSSTFERCAYLGISSHQERALFWDTEAFVLWDLDSEQRWRLPPTEAVRLLPDGTGAVFLDAQGGAWGWTPGQEPVRLGQSRATRSCGIESPLVQAASSGTLLFIGTDGEASLWTPRTRQVRAVGSQVVSGQLSDSGERLALLHRTPRQESFVTVQAPALGTRWTVWRGEEPKRMELSGSGERLALAVRVHPDGLDPEESFHAVRLWDVETGAEVALQPASPHVRHWWPDFGFYRHSELLHVSMNDGDWVYSARTGEKRFSTARATIPGEGNYSYWGPGEFLYAPMGAYMPPDKALFAWDPRTGIETQVVGMNELLCFLGQGPVLHTGDARALEARRAALVHWNPDTRQLQTLSPLATLARCIESRGAVAFYEDWQDSARGTLTVVEPARQCRWRVDTEVERNVSVDGGLVYQSRGQVWRARLP